MDRSPRATAHRLALTGLAALTLCLSWLTISGCGSNKTTAPVLNPMPDFSLTDVNLNSPRHGQSVSPRQYRTAVSAWYFGHAT